MPTSPTPLPPLPRPLHQPPSPPNPSTRDCHTHTHTHSLTLTSAFSLSFTQTQTLILSLSLSFSLTLTHTLTLNRFSSIDSATFQRLWEIFTSEMRSASTQKRVADKHSISPALCRVSLYWRSQSHKRARSQPHKVAK